MSNATLSVVIPAYNEEDGIATILDRVLKVRPELKELGINTEVIVVDDGCCSTRSTRTTAARSRPASRMPPAI